PGLDREGRPPAGGRRDPRRLRRDRRREAAVAAGMDRILILGGGVGGTLAANLLAKRLRKRIDAGEVDVTVVDEAGEHVYQPGFMYIAMGGEKPEGLVRSERSLLDKRVKLHVGTATT